jgi:hypothetical protein
MLCVILDPLGRSKKFFFLNTSIFGRYECARV